MTFLAIRAPFAAGKHMAEVLQVSLHHKDDLVRYSFVKQIANLTTDCPGHKCWQALDLSSDDQARALSLGD